MSQYTFANYTYNTLPKLANAMGKQWHEGKAFLFSGQFRSQVRNDNKDLANACQYWERKYHADPKKVNLLFLQWLIRLPDVKNLYWMGKDYGTLENVLELLKLNGSTDANKLFLLMVQEQLMSEFAEKSGKSENVINNVRYLERCYNKKDTRFRRNNINRLLYVVLSEEMYFLFDEHQFRTVNTLSAYLQKFANQSKGKLSSKVDLLFQDDANLVPDFEGWLLNLGYQKEINLWKERFQEGATDRIDDYWVWLEEAERQEEVSSEKDNSLNGKPDKPEIVLESDPKYEDINRLRQLEANIEDEDVSSKMKIFEGRVRKIIDRLDPKDEPHSVYQKFKDHYVQIVLTALEKLDALQVDKNDGEVYGAIIKNTNGLLDTANKAAGELLASQLRGDVTDVETDLAALKMQLEMDGFLEIEKED